MQARDQPLPASDRQAAVRVLAESVTGWPIELSPVDVLFDRVGMPYQLAWLLALAAIVPTMFVLLRRVVFRPAGRAPQRPTQLPIQLVPPSR